MTSRARRRLGVGILAAATLLSACTTSGKGKGSSAGSTPPASPASSTTAVKPKAPLRNPYTGIGAVPTAPVIAVKIDDTAPGRPQLGIDQADIVYIEAVEGGLTRLAAIYGTRKPTVGYVRSTRPSDPDLLLQFGKITEAYSGGAHDSLPLLYRSGITAWSDQRQKPYFFRVNRSESAYINLALNLAKVAKAVHTNRPRSIGWVFSSRLIGVPTQRGTRVRTVVTGSYSNGTPVEFRWDAHLRKYVRYIGGIRQVAADGRPVTATNVVVQSCRVVSHPQDTDINHNPSQFTYTVGSGLVSVFRDGKRIVGRWSRPRLNTGTVFRTTSGRIIPLEPGNTWVVLARAGVPVYGS